MEPAGQRVLEQFGELRRFILEDLDRVVSEPVGGNFALAALVGCGYDLLGQLQARDPHEVFGESLPPEWRPVASSIYDAMRNGLVHKYTPKTIQVGSGVRLSISWREVPHLAWKGDYLVLRAPDLVDGLRARWLALEQHLESSRTAREQFARALRQHHVVEVKRSAESAAWAEILAAREDPAE